MGKLFNGDKEFEKNKKEILRRMKTTNPKLSISDNKNDIISKKHDNKGNHKYAWEYEIEEYRKKKNLERFYKIGAIAGIISLIITIVDKFVSVKEITYTAVSHIIK